MHHLQPSKEALIWPMFEDRGKIGSVLLIDSISPLQRTERSSRGARRGVFCSLRGNMAVSKAGRLASVLSEE